MISSSLRAFTDESRQAYPQPRGTQTYPSFYPRGKTQMRAHQVSLAHLAGGDHDITGCHSTCQLLAGLPPHANNTACSLQHSHGLSLANADPDNFPRQVLFSRCNRSLVALLRLALDCLQSLLGGYTQTPTSQRGSTSLAWNTPRHWLR